MRLGDNPEAWKCTYFVAYRWLHVYELQSRRMSEAFTHPYTSVAEQRIVGEGITNGSGFRLSYMNAHRSRMAKIL